MKLFKGFFAAYLFLFAGLTFAYEYPYTGDLDNFKPVFQKISQDKCDELNDDLIKLEKAEGVSPEFYLALCFFENNKPEKGYEAVNRMIDNEEFDEAIYLLNIEEAKENYTASHFKVKGKAAYGQGNLDEALKCFLKLKEAGTSDAETDYMLVDILLNSGEQEKAEKELEQVKIKDDRYSYRKGFLELNKGNVQTSLKHLRSVKEQPFQDAFASSNYLIGEICEAQERLGCAEKAYSNLEQNFARQKIENMNKNKKFFGATIAIGEQYDTNVTSVDDDKAENFSEKESFRTYIFADFKLNFYNLLYDKIETGLLNYKSWNHSVSEYNAQIHKLYAGFIKRYDNFEIELPRLSYTLTYMDDKKYSDTFNVEAKGTYFINSWSIYTPLSISFKNFDENINSDFNRDGETYSFGLGVSKSFAGNHILTAETKAGVEDTKGKYSRTNTGEFNLGFTTKISEDVTARLSYEAIVYDYKHGGRKDTYNDLAAIMLYEFSERHFINIGYSFIKNDSNQNINDYKKHVFDIGVNYLY